MLTLQVYIMSVLVSNEKIMDYVLGVIRMQVSLALREFSTKIMIRSIEAICEYTGEIWRYFLRLI